MTTYLRNAPRARKTPQSPEQDPSIEQIVHDAILRMQQQQGQPAPQIKLPAARPAPPKPQPMARRTTPIPIPQPKKLKTRVQVLQQDEQYQPYTQPQPVAQARHRVTGSKEEVWNGIATRTSGGLTRADLTMNSRGNIVSLKRSENARQRFQINHTVHKVV